MSDTEAEKVNKEGAQPQNTEHHTPPHGVVRRRQHISISGSIISTQSQWLCGGGEQDKPLCPDCVCPGPKGTDTSQAAKHFSSCSCASSSERA